MNSLLFVGRPCLVKAKIVGPLVSSAISQASIVSIISQGLITFKFGIALKAAKCSKVDG